VSEMDQGKAGKRERRQSEQRGYKKGFIVG